jgi:hypothetical protein
MKQNATSVSSISWKRIAISVASAVAVALIAFWIWKISAAPTLHSKLPPKQTKAPVEIRISIRGTILDPKGAPVASARAYLLRWEGGKGPYRWADERSTNANGEYAFEKIAGYDANNPMHKAHLLREPQYMVVGEKGGFGFALARITQPTADRAGVDISLSSRCLSAAGVVQDEDGVPMANVAVIAGGEIRNSARNGETWERCPWLPHYYGYSDTPPSPSSKPVPAEKIPPPFIRLTDGNGRFSFTGLPSRDRIAFGAEFPGYFDAGDSKNEPFEDLTIVLKKKYHLWARLISATDGTPLANVPIMLLDENGVTMGGIPCYTRPSGAFGFNALFLGKYRLTTNSGYTLEPEMIELTRSNWQEVLLIKARK